jgi:hypothetical protein
MNRKSRLFAVVALFFTIACGQALAWNSIGHMAVAYAAYQQLTPAEQARVTALLKLNPNYAEWLGFVKKSTPNATDAQRDEYVFMMAATWPDEIKAMGSGYFGTDTPPKGESATLNTGYSDKNMHRYWHFINNSFSTDGTPLPLLPHPTIVEKIVAFRAAVASDEPDALKSYDLIWLEHMVGDVHQPLHAAARVTKAQPKGDQGGNLILVSGPSKELHAYWDTILGSGDTQNFETAVKVGSALPKADDSLAQDANEADWADESFKLARSSVYIAPIGDGSGPYTPTASYAAQAKQIAQQRVALAGARLAELLKTALKCGDQNCTH